MGYPRLRLMKTYTRAIWRTRRTVSLTEGDREKWLITGGIALGSRKGLFSEDQKLRNVTVYREIKPPNSGQERAHPRTPAVFSSSSGHNSACSEGQGRAVWGVGAWGRGGVRAWVRGRWGVGAGLRRCGIIRLARSLFLHFLRQFPSLFLLSPLNFYFHLIQNGEQLTIISLYIHQASPLSL